MFLRIEQSPISPDEPWKGDLFQRENFAVTIANLLRTASHSSVIGLSAPFGFGKTFFLQRLRMHIKNEKGWVVYVNAWEYDYLESPLFALLDALKIAAADQVVNKREVAKVLKQLGKAAMPAVAKAAAKKFAETILSAEGAKEIGDAFSEASGKAVEALMDRFAKEDTTHQALNVLRERIRDFVKEHLAEDSPYQNLLVIVDELDRARPNFSIRFLETIKHLFGLSQIVFLIGCDRSALIASAQHEYGANLETDGYLRRLFDYWIELPAPKPQQYVFHCIQRLNLIADRVLRPHDQVTDSERIYAELLLLGQKAETVSLRFVEQSVAHANVVLRIAPTDKQAGLIGWLQGLKQFAPQLYEPYISNRPISEIYISLKNYEPFRGASTFFQAFIFLWIANSKEPLTDELLRFLIGEGQQLYGMIKDITRSMNFDAYHESMACRIDRRMRTVSLTS